MKRKDWPQGKVRLLSPVTIWGSQDVEKIVEIAHIARRLDLTVSLGRGERKMYTVTVVCSPQQADQIEQEMKRSKDATQDYTVHGA
jgi:hypothetical protein